MNLNLAYSPVVPKATAAAIIEALTKAGETTLAEQLADQAGANLSETERALVTRFHRAAQNGDVSSIDNDGGTEVDESPVVSFGECTTSAYVQTWTWVDLEEVGES